MTGGIVSRSPSEFGFLDDANDLTASRAQSSDRRFDLEADTLCSRQVLQYCIETIARAGELIDDADTRIAICTSHDLSNIAPYFVAKWVFDGFKASACQDAHAKCIPLPRGHAIKMNVIRIFEVVISILFDLPKLDELIALVGAEE